MGLDGSRLKSLREMKGLRRQQALADLVGVPQSHICDLEKGKLRNEEIFLRVADELDCTTDFLFRRGPFKNADTPELLRAAGSRMAFDSFVERLNVTALEKERCRRVLGHPYAPVTADGWNAFAEMVALAVGSQPPRIRAARA